MRERILECTTCKGRWRETPDHNCYRITSGHRYCPDGCKAAAPVDQIPTKPETWRDRPPLF